MPSEQPTSAFTAYYPRQSFFLGLLITPAFWLGAWLLSEHLDWGYALLLFPGVVVIMTLATGRTFVLSGKKLYRGKACIKVIVDLEHAKRANFQKSPSPLFRDDSIFFLMDPRLGKGIDGYHLAIGNFRSAPAAEFTKAIERRIVAARAGEES